MTSKRLDMPTWFQFGVTNRCNFNCPMCPRKSLNVEIRDMPFRLYRKLLSRLPTAGLVSLLGLGEPLLHRRIFDMVRLAEERGNLVSITTNGSLLDAGRREMVLESSLHYLRVSVDSVKPEAHPSGHPVIGKVLSNCSAMADIRGDSARPHLMFNTLVSEATHEGISDVIQAAKDIGFDAVNLIRLARNTESAQRVAPGIEEACFEEWHRLGEGSGIEVRSTYESRSAPPRYCPFWTNYIYINLYGDVTPCCHLPGRQHAVGNLRRQTLREVWHGERMRRFWSEQYYSVCAGCTLMTWLTPEEQRSWHTRRQPEAMPADE
jgi:radical SAM protein with 4Fe4S-binding SPASM domain